MRQPRLILALILPVLGAMQGAHAQKLSPGLWDMTMTMKSASGEMESQMARMQAELANMPPDQRKMVEGMMAQRGVGMAPGAGGGTAIRTCISKERAERGEIPDQQDRNCKRENMDRSGSTIKFKMSCSNPPSTGEGEFTFSSDKAFTGKMLFDTQVKGKPERMEVQQQGKWISADCGNILPR